MRGLAGNVPRPYGDAPGPVGSVWRLSGFAGAATTNHRIQFVDRTRAACPGLARRLRPAADRRKEIFVSTVSGSVSTIPSSFTDPATSSDAASMVSFSSLGLAEPLLRALSAHGYQNPTPIQAQAIPPLLGGRDLLGCARTGTGKTAAFALPILDRLVRARAARPGVRALVLTPTRELAAQVRASFLTYGKHLRFQCATVFGGVGQEPQVQALRRGAEVVIATPGRLLDLMEQGHVPLSGLEVLVLDEADRMLDMGFIQPIRRILAALPRVRQTLLLSATMPPEIAKLAASILRDPARIAVDPVSSTVDKISQRVLFVERVSKVALLRELLRDPAAERVLVFTRTKHGANKVAQQLDRTGVATAAIHGNKSQGARQRALSDFKDARVRVLVATDIAARGIDIDGITHVINLDIPNEPESYVHRIGRTARAGAAGVALSFCDGEERDYLRAIERLTGTRLEVVADHPFANGQRPPAPPAAAESRPHPRPHAPARRSFGRRRR
jgi:ATP-dependent RNA helicase RhlE